MKVSRPAIISYPRTYLECVAGDLLYTQLLDKAAECEDPVQRMKYVTAFVVAGLHRNSVEMGNNGPLNPVLGETFNAEKADGTQLYCEQISHHPPVSAYLMVHPQGNYKLYGKGEVAARLSGLNTIHGLRIGCTFIEFKNGGQILIENPDMYIDGLMMGDRTLNYIRSFNLRDFENKLTSTITFNYEEKGTLGKLASGFTGLFKSKAATEKPAFDTFSVGIYKGDSYQEVNESAKVLLAKGSGSWLSHIELDGEVYWRQTDEVGEERWVEKAQYKLESDSTNRLDSKFIKEKNYDQAQKEKDLLENVQRNDAKLRKAAKEGAGKTAAQ